MFVLPVKLQCWTILYLWNYSQVKFWSDESAAVSVGKWDIGNSIFLPWVLQIDTSYADILNKLANKIINKELKENIICTWLLIQGFMLGSLVKTFKI